MANFKLTKRLLAGFLGGRLLYIVNLLLYSDMLRSMILRLVRNLIKASLNAEHAPPNQRKILLQRELMSLAIIKTIERSIAERFIDNIRFRIYYRLINDIIISHLFPPFLQFYKSRDDYYLSITELSMLHFRAKE